MLPLQLARTGAPPGSSCKTETLGWPSGNHRPSSCSVPAGALAEVTFSPGITPVSRGKSAGSALGMEAGPETAYTPLGCTTWFVGLQAGKQCSLCTVELSQLPGQ